jgi:hypothetical protein
MACLAWLWSSSFSILFLCSSRPWPSPPQLETGWRVLEAMDSDEDLDDSFYSAIDQLVAQHKVRGALTSPAQLGLLERRARRVLSVLCACRM